MYQYRHILVRMRLGESDRQIDAAGLMGRRTAAKLRKKALKEGWLDSEQPLPTEQAEGIPFGIGDLAVVHGSLPSFGRD